MKSSRVLVLLFFVVMFYAGSGIIQAQSQPILYFCEKYGSNGEVGIADRFSTGYLTVMVKSDSELDLEECFIQFDKWDAYTGKFKYYKKFTYNIEPDMSYVYFSKNSESDMSFDEPGFYRVFLLDDDNETVASSLVQIVE
jgi:hypothetical protein